MNVVMRGLLVAACLCGCAGRGEVAPAPTRSAEPPPPAPTPDALFGQRLDRQLDAYFEAHPVRAVELGLHAYDGELPDVSADGVAREVERLERALEDLQDVDESVLSLRRRAELAALRTTLAAERFDLVERRVPFRHPAHYLEMLAPTPYVARPYAPVDDRVRAMIKLARATPTHLQHAAENLDERLPKTFVDNGLLQTRGLIAFVRDDVPEAFAELQDSALRVELEGALAEMVTALETFETVLEKRLRKANHEFALGPEAFERMLAQSQGLEIPIERLREVLQADLDRNFEALKQAAKELDPKRSVTGVVKTVLEDRPATDRVLAVAREQTEQVRAFIAERELVSIPSEHTVQVVETPPFMRWNVAFLDSAGPFERTPLPSFYYISPPNPKWPRSKRESYVPGTVDLLFITIHEVWPGHFLHSLHTKNIDSRVLKSLWNYTTGEGWAHYAEEMMWEAGISTEPRVRVGQLVNALLRDVRALSAIGLHTGEMTVAQSKRLFMKKAFQDAASAEQQAARGTFDPMYLGYTLGKLILVKLRDDYIAAQQAAGNEPSLASFHDEILSMGGAPLPLVREAVLGPDAGPVL